MNASAHFVAAKRHNDALDLPPVAEADHIAGVTALLGAMRPLLHGSEVGAPVLRRVTQDAGHQGERGDDGQVKLPVAG